MKLALPLIVNKLVEDLLKILPSDVNVPPMVIVPELYKPSPLPLSLTTEPLIINEPVA